MSQPTQQLETPSTPVYVAPKAPKRTEDELKSLQTKQMLAFIGLGAISVTTALMGRRSVLSRQFTPHLFDSNNKPPSFNLVKDAAVAVAIASTMAVSTFAFTLTGFSWLAGIGSLKEFSLKAKSLMGGLEKEAVYLNAPEDPELEKLGESFEQVLGTKKS